jgi:hypothetical protein
MVFQEGGQTTMRKKTLRRLPPVTREYGKLLNQLDSLSRKFKNRLPEIQRMEADSRALAGARNPEFWYPEPATPEAEKYLAMLRTLNPAFKFRCIKNDVPFEDESPSG